MTDMLSSAPVWRLIEFLFVASAFIATFVLGSDAMVAYLVIAIFCEIHAQRSEGPSDHE